MAGKRHSGVSDQIKASRHRLDDAQALFEKGRWRGCMYLAGYSLECLLKAKLMQRFRCQTLEVLEQLLHSRRLLSRSDRYSPMISNACYNCWKPRIA